MFSKRSLHFASALSVGLLGLKNVIPKRSGLKFDEERYYKNEKLSLFPGILSPKVFAHPESVQTADGVKLSDNFKAFECRVTDKLKMDLSYDGPIGGHAKLMEFENWFVYYDMNKKRQIFQASYLTNNCRGINHEQEICDRKQKEVEYIGKNSVLTPAFKIVRALQSTPMSQALADGPWHQLHTTLVQPSLSRDPTEMIFITGPLYIKEYEQQFPKKREFQGFDIPSYFFAIIIEEHGNDMTYKCYIMENSASTQNMQFLIVPIDTIEKHLGHSFIPFKTTHL